MLVSVLRRRGEHMADTVRAYLEARGWIVSHVFDICWMDHDEPGFYKEWVSSGAKRVICLCVPDALVLEEGEYEGSYSGALTPSDSMAVEWPWRPYQPEWAGGAQEPLAAVAG
jgi:hypothetical protein